ncbi:urea transporter [Saitoella complicata NRRL Y-17804]|uniref:Urea active transporter n=1 Tax=Saitoella complicata (strain BCRC 22490 / CBS 7301 / JCM 7358 / NBRC 10748 / NRRL Y-17804) TaxID=698492 RepID=A0A0E9N8B1_SAICN|nr:urea transporter [Saitoella complicata NRRL Y-17804]ODQ55733.1 urea transporter [Saitoella complicata NRRL Y-17804]GAO46147.1 hypothetical protein G7K_0386-t1 [Saitoella complicata NRRL Y-17804]
MLEIQVFEQSMGYGMVVGVGLFFAAVMACISMVQNRYTSFNTHSSEEFNTASRSVKPGLIASGIVSAWTWAATLLQSSTVAYQYGVAGPFWYASGATMQIIWFSILAVKTKQNAPRAHTYLEIIHTRYGTQAHIVFICFALMTNIIVASELLLGGSAVLSAITGMSVYAANFLIPIVVAIYVALGGLRATFLCDYSHTVILFIVILYFVFHTYTGGADSKIGSISEMWHLLERAAEVTPVAGNEGGSYLTLKSNFALIFGVIQLCSGSGTVFLDQGYWQRAIASKPETSVKAYLLGGLAWYPIPFAFATTMGLGAVALTIDNPLTASQVSSGLAAPAAATLLLGKLGAGTLLLCLFMAVTSAASAQLIAVSSILTFDIWKMYVRKNAEGPELVKVSHIMIGVFAIVMAVFACIWHSAGIDLGWLFLVMGLLIGGAVFPVAYTVTWNKQPKIAAIAGALSGLTAGLTSWLVVAKCYYGEITVASTGANYSTLAGNLAAIGTGAIVSTTLTLLKPENFDWEITRAIGRNSNIQMGHGGVVTTSPTAVVNSEGNSRSESPNGINEKPSMPEKDVTVLASTEPEALLEEDVDPALLHSAYNWAKWASIIMTLVLDVIIPLPLFFSHYKYSEGFFKGWVVVSIIWTFIAAFICVLLPIWESREAIMVLCRGMKKDMFGGR